MNWREKFCNGAQSFAGAKPMTKMALQTTGCVSSDGASVVGQYAMPMAHNLPIDWLAASIVEVESVLGRSLEAEIGVPASCVPLQQPGTFSR
jgi:hypothetical protein